MSQALTPGEDPAPAATPPSMQLDLFGEPL